MSASLVGSEMCIRDRPCIKPHVWGRTCLVPGPFEVEAVVCGRLARLVSVSYTHLTLPTICSV
eukprot:12422191-Alexandrium_andersonii.AAC.1